MFPMTFGDRTELVSKIQEQDFTSAHHNCLSQMQYNSGQLIFPNSHWQSIYLGAGEEKAVYCVRDHSGKVFALELINEPHYLNGRYVGGTYFFNKRVSALNNIKANPDSDFGLTFTGLVKVREFVYGYEWSRFQFDPRRTLGIDALLTSFLQSLLITKYNWYESHYKDVHARNILFEIRPFQQSGIPVLVRDWAGKLNFAKVGLQPVDVR